MPDDLRWTWCNSNRSKDKCNELDSSWNHPRYTGPWKNCFPRNPPLVPKKLGNNAKGTQIGLRVGARLKRKDIYIYSYDWFTLWYGRNQHNIVKQLSSIKKNKFKETQTIRLSRYIIYVDVLIYIYIFNTSEWTSSIKAWVCPITFKMDFRCFAFLLIDEIDDFPFFALLCKLFGNSI